jgi:hypothetical protein
MESRLPQTYADKEEYNGVDLPSMYTLNEGIDNIPFLLKYWFIIS